MMAIAAKGICPTSAYQPETLSTIFGNIEVSEVWVGFDSSTSPLFKTSHRTFDNIQHCVADPMHAGNFHSNHDWH